jgi:hypothetical protein
VAFCGELTITASQGISPTCIFSWKESVLIRSQRILCSFVKGGISADRRRLIDLYVPIYRKRLRSRPSLCSASKLTLVYFQNRLGLQKATIQKPFSLRRLPLQSWIYNTFNVESVRRQTVITHSTMQKRMNVSNCKRDRTQENLTKHVKTLMKNSNKLRKYGATAYLLIH